MSRAEDAALLRDFAAAVGRSLRTARDYRRDPATGKPRPEWVDFLRSRGLAPGKADDGSASAELTDYERSRRAAENAHAALLRLQSMHAVAIS